MRSRLRRWLGAYRRVRSSYLWTLLGMQRRWIYGLLTAGILNFLIIIGILDTLRKAFDGAIVEQYDYLDPLVTALTGLAFLGLFTGIAQRQIIARIGYHLEYQLRVRLYNQLQSLDPRLLDGLPTGQLLTRAMTDLTLVELLVQLIPTLGVAITVLLALAGLVLYMHPVMGVIALAGIPVNLYLISRVRKPLWGFSWLALNRRAQVTTAIDEAVRGIRVVKSFGREDDERVRVRDAARRAYAVSLNRVRMMARYDLILQAIPVVLNGVILLVAGRVVANGEFSVGELLIFLIFTRVFTGIAQQFDEIASGWMFAKSGAARIFELLAWGGDEVPGAARQTVELPPSDEGLALHGVEVRFGDNVALPAIDLDVAPGELVVLTGPPGSGKSLVAAVAAGLSPTSGAATIEGVALADLDRADLGRAVRVLAEDPFLFARSVRHNLEVGAPLEGARPDDDTLLAALRAAAVDDVVAQLPDGLDTALGDRGMTLSGGQRQRVALARALVSPPRVLVLDDALSAVNPALEVEILQRIRRHVPDMGILCITRRPGARAIADTVFTLPDPDRAAEAPVTWQAAVEAAVAGRGDLPPDAELTAVVDALPQDRDEPEVGERPATETEERPTVLHVLRPFRRKVVVAIALLMGYTLVGLIPEGLFKIAVDDFREGVYADSDKVAIVLMLIAGALGVLAYFLKIYTAKVNEGVLYLLRRRTFQRLSRLGIDYYDRELPGQVAARVVHDLDRITSFLETGVYQMATAITIVVASFTIVVVWNPEVGAGVLRFLPILVILTAVQVPLANRAYKHARAKLGEVIERFQEDVAGRYVISAYGIRDQAGAELNERAKGLRAARRRSTLISNVYVELMQYFGWLALATVVDRAGNLHLEGVLSAGSVIALQLYLSRAMQPIPQLSDLLQRYLAARASFATLRTPYDAPVLPVEREETKEAPPLDGDVVLDGVRFRYPGTERHVLDDVSLEVPARSSVALVGPTGAGKSSIAKVVARIYDVDEGAVRVGADDVRDLDLRSYRRRFGVVPQDAFCFSGTVASNIAYGRPDASRDEIEAAVEAVGAAGVLGRIPGGLDGFVDEEGRNLTAAQRQLVALARAVLVEPDVLVLDEATSSLDEEHEAAMLEAVSSLGRTTLFITHRLPVARRADKVAVVDGGRVVEVGTHAELLRRHGAYAGLWTSGDGDGNGKRTRRARPLRAKR